MCQNKFEYCLLEMHDKIHKKYTQKYQARKKNSKNIQTMMEYRHCVCGFHQAHSTPNGVGQTEAKTDYKKFFLFLW